MTVTLVYDVVYPAGCPIRSSVLGTQLGNIAVDQGELAKLGYSITSDTVFILGGAIRRTIVLDPTNTAGTGSSPTPADEIAMTTNLWTQRLAAGMPAEVTETPPVVT